MPEDRWAVEMQGEVSDKENARGLFAAKPNLVELI